MFQLNTLCFVVDGLDLDKIYFLKNKIKPNKFYTEYSLKNH